MSETPQELFQSNNNEDNKCITGSVNKEENQNQTCKQEKADNDGSNKKENENVENGHQKVNGREENNSENLETLNEKIQELEIGWFSELINKEFEENLNNSHIPTSSSDDLDKKPKEEYYSSKPKQIKAHSPKNKFVKNLKEKGKKKIDLENLDLINLLSTTNPNHYMRNIMLYNIFTFIDNMNQNEEFNLESIANVCSNHDHYNNNLRYKDIYYESTNEITFYPNIFSLNDSISTSSTNDTTIKYVYN